MKQLLLEFRKMDNSIMALIKSGFKFCFGINLIANIILLTYNFFYATPALYHIGISLFKTSLFFIVGFIICGFAFNKILKDLEK